MVVENKVVTGAEAGGTELVGLTGGDPREFVVVVTVVDVTRRVVGVLVVELEELVSGTDDEELDSGTDDEELDAGKDEDELDTGADEEELDTGIDEEEELDTRSEEELEDDNDGAQFANRKPTHKTIAATVVRIVPI